MKGAIHMRKLFAWILMVIFLFPLTLSCVPSGYEGKNPNKPDQFQIDKEKLGTPPSEDEDSDAVSDQEESQNGGD